MGSIYSEEQSRFFMVSGSRVQFVMMVENAERVAPEASSPDWYMLCVEGLILKGYVKSGDYVDVITRDGSRLILEMPKIFKNELPCMIGKPGERVRLYFEINHNGMINSGDVFFRYIPRYRKNVFSPAEIDLLDENKLNNLSKEELISLDKKLTDTFIELEYGNWEDGAPEWVAWERRLNRLQFMGDQIKKILEMRRPVVFYDRLKMIEGVFNSPCSTAEKEKAKALLNEIVREMKNNDRTIEETSLMMKLMTASRSIG